MGRIFTWQEILERKIPTLKDFEVIKETVKQQLIKNEKVIGALLLGSGLRGDYSVRSDLDFLVLYKENIFSELRNLVSLAKKRFVPLQIIPLRIEVAQKGVHNLQEGDFIEHLRWAAKNGGVIKENPLEFIRLKKIEPKVILENTFRVIANNVSKSICELSWYEGEKKMILLAKLLEAPRHIVRQVVWFKRKGIPEENEERIITSYIEIIRDTKLLQLLREILNTDKSYSAKLDMILRAGNKKYWEEEYRSILQKIEKIDEEKVPEFVERNISLFTK